MADTQFTITIPEAQTERVLSALAAKFGYNAAEDGPRGAFVRGNLIELIKRLVLATEARQARQAAARADAPDVT